MFAPDAFTGAARGFEFADPYAAALLAAGLTLLIAVVALSQQRERAFSAAVLYLLIGAGISIALQAGGEELLDPLQDHDVIERAAEFAVIVVLFSVGIRLDRPLGWRSWGSTIRLIALVMPLTIAGIAAFASLAMGLSLGAAIVLGAVLAPTDPVLAGEVQVGPPGDEDEPEPHFALTSEAGLNDGLAFPFVFLGLFIASGEGDWALEWIVADVIWAVGVGVAIGLAAGWGLGALTAWLRERRLLLSEYDGWLAVAAVLVIYGTTELAGAYGFLAAFAGGLAFRRRERHHASHGRVHEGAEIVEKLSELALVLLFGSTVTIAGLQEPGLAGWLLVPALLLVIRPGVVLLSFARSRLSLAERAFVGWFGIRGIGSFYYAAVAIGAGVLSPDDAAVVYWTVLVCAGVSITLHGITATPLTRALARTDPGSP